MTCPQSPARDGDRAKSGAQGVQSLEVPGAARPWTAAGLGDESMKPRAPGDLARQSVRQPAVTAR